MLYLPKLIIRAFVATFATWVVLTTAIPQIALKYTNPEVQANTFVLSLYPYSSITNPSPLPLQNSTIYLVIGHPDDEVMFFSPTLVELTKPKYNNIVHVVCFSKGDAVDTSMGAIRSKELLESTRILGVPHENVSILDYQDGMDQNWSVDDIQRSLHTIAKSAQPVVFITFDEQGVLSHPNHISLHHGTKAYFKSHASPADKLYVLKSLNFWEKYSFTFLTNVELFVNHVSEILISNLLNININISFFTQTNQSHVRIYSDLNMLSVSYAAMAYGHFSQMVWFRYGWLLLSRYLTFNHLIQVQ